MAGSKLATAYYELIPETSNAEEDITKSLAGAGKTAGKGFSSNFSSVLTGAVAGIAASLTSSLTSQLSALWSDAIDASDATDKFKSTLSFAGLDDGTISSLTDQVQSYADKTVYSLSDIQSITSQLAANGVSDYEQLAEAAGNLNAVAGGNAETYKSVGMALTQTAGAGKLTTENWNQLANAIPGASGKLQDALSEAGAYTGNFRDAMADGQISAEEFNEALLSLGMTDVAQDAATSTSTIEGAVGNLQATVVGGLSDMITSAKPQITAFIGYASEVVSGLFSGFKNLVSWVSANSTWLGPLVAGLLAGVVAVNAWTTATKLAAAAQAALTVVMNANPIMLVVTAIAALVAGLVWFFTQTELGQQIWSGFVSWFQALISGFSAWWSSVWTSVGNFFTSLWQGVSSFFTGLWNGITAFIRGVLNLFVSWFMNWTVYGIIISHWQEISDFFVAVWNGITSFVSSAINNVSSTVSRVLSAIGDGWNAAWRGMSDFVSGVFQGLVGVIKRPVNAIISVVNSMINGLNRISIDLPDWVGDLTGVYSIGFDIPNIPQLATGGTITRGGMALVGERGPELVSLPTGSTVYDAYQTASALPGGVTLNVNVSGRSYQSPAALGEVIGVKVAQAIGGVR